MTATDAKNEFGRERAGGAQPDRLTGEFDALLSGMQRQRSRAAMKAAFGASPKRLGRAAVAAARRRD